MAGAPPPYGLVVTADLDAVAAARYEMMVGEELGRVRPTFTHRLKYVQNRKVVIICDDSGSMGDPTDDSMKNVMGGSARAMVSELMAASPAGLTRWHELQVFLRSAIKVYAPLSPGGVDVFFLNRAGVLGVKTWEQLAGCFKEPPAGHTPLSNIMEHVIARYKCGERGTIVNIVTDGEPYMARSSGRRDDMDRFARTLQSKPETMAVNIRLCVDEDEAGGARVVQAYGALDKDIPLLDVNDSYKDEREGVKKASKIEMTPGEYFLKATIGAADQSKGKRGTARPFDKWDEKRRWRWWG